MNLKPHHFHEDPQVLHVGTCPDRSYYIPYAGEKEAEYGLLLPGDFPKRHLGFPVFHLL